MKSERPTDKKASRAPRKGAATTRSSGKKAAAPSAIAFAEPPPVVTQPLVPLEPPPPGATGDQPAAPPVMQTSPAEPKRPHETPPPPQPSAAPAATHTTADSIPLPDMEAMSLNAARLIEQGGKALAAYIRPIEEGRIHPEIADNFSDAVKTFGKVAEYWLADPQRTVHAQSALTTNFIQLWANTLLRFSGETPAPVVPPDPSDKRFADPEWKSNPVFDFLRQAYALSTNWATDLVTNAENVDPATREKAQFYLRQISSAISPSNFVPTNPELLRSTIEQNGENLVRGMQMLAEDIEAGKGQLKIRQSDPSKFVLGVNMAATPGKVVFRNDIFELIQYAPTTETVFRRPLLIVPPWINKYYILDLNPEKSFVRWAVAQGLTVFMVSWVNPDERQASKSFEEYMREGILAALDAIEQATGERDIAAIGYCVGGTLLSITLAYMALTGDTRISSATLFTTQVDFTDPGDLKHFVDPERIQSIEASMAESGYLEGARMASAFNMLRPTELIWNYIVNNYVRGKEPPAFDLLVWNSDSTRMPMANHSFYLRNCYLENNLTRGRMVIAGKKLDLAKVKVPIYCLATREDHIAPAKSVFTGSKFFGGDMRFVLAGSGHIAGVVNPADKPKYQYWTGPKPVGDLESWLGQATEHPGTWWPDWLAWLSAQAPERVPAREPGAGKLPALCDAPGEYVRVKA